jgi:tetratricopeptide (TPR) repeat protein
LTPTLNKLFEVFELANLQHDPDAAEQKLQTIADVKLPKIGEAVRWAAMARIQLLRHKPAAALEAANKAQGYYPDMPAVHYYQGLAHNQLGQWDQALRCLQSYQQVIGDQWHVCLEMGDALHRLERFADAAHAYRKSLDDVPENALVFQKLLAALRPKDRKDDLGARFAKLPSPHQHFDVFSGSCRWTRDSEALEQLSLAMQKIDPKFAQADLCLALAKAWSGQSDEAIACFVSAMNKQPDVAKREEYARQFLPAIAPTPGAVKAYSVAPYSRPAFATLAAELKAAERFDELRELIDIHGADDPEDPVLITYRSELPLEPRQQRRDRFPLDRPPGRLLSR